MTFGLVFGIFVLWFTDCVCFYYKSLLFMPQKLCTAKSRRTGLPCRGFAIKGRDKCRMHGGKTPFRKDGSRSKYKATVPTLLRQRAKIDADPKLVSAEEFLKKHGSIINQLWDDLSEQTEECVFCGGSSGNLLAHPALKPLLENLATATARASAIEELKVKKGYYFSMAEIANWMLHSLIPLVQDLLLPNKQKVLEERLTLIDIKRDP